MDSLFRPGLHPPSESSLVQEINWAWLEEFREVLEDNFGKFDIQKNIHAGKVEVAEEAEEENG